MAIPIGTIEERARHDICLMVDRNTASGVLEKGFHISRAEIYQLHPNSQHQLYLIAVPNVTLPIVAITDNFLFDSG